MIEHVGIVGCGTMGAGIAEICAKAGLDVLVAVSSAASAEAGQARITKSLQRAVRKGKLAVEDADRLRAAIRFTESLGDLADRQLVVESVHEEEKLKRRLFADLEDALTDPATIIATNTSSMRITPLADCTRRPHRVVGTHFFNPATVMPLVELVPAEQTGAEVIEAVEAFLTGSLGKQVIRSADRPGFVVNALLVPYLVEAVRLVGDGHATAEDVDRGMKLGCSHPLGPIELVDMIGLDVIASVADALEVTKPRLLTDLISSGRLGVKTGAGFFDYPR
ncbi:3-hydroxybutyryl-CoA dehydrogenase [Actinoplanes cyaneus]|uniref:3-hydroxybutyryl-CoA dehydrogenase n=1 Tax=Actinoplanes cyaneus TaxID=52696 RepID=A0A919ITF8_9ACTN|nr:3-hydroxybutyryl-CoA dehydrogenase [Actinoplanes cyaneus]MCW2144189.1 3-hydroxyacyl-CoA dehydrogenase [Actinoplanes cyaneus]GID70951.1 3-hydroxybutyryl-CoA dehydrogenase [Actinoplanes cyaneus]